MPPHVLVDFVVGTPMRRSYVVPDDVSGDIGGCSARTALKPKFY